MVRYKDGSIITLFISLFAFIAGSILIYIGNDRIEIKGSKNDGNIRIEKTALKLYFYQTGSEIIGKVNDVKFRTETAEDKSLISTVTVLSNSDKLVLVPTNSRITDAQKRELFNDLDFFIRNNRPEYYRSYSFTNNLGILGFSLSAAAILSFFSSLLYLLNRILVERDKTRFAPISGDSIRSILLIPKNISLSEEILDSIKTEEISKTLIAAGGDRKKDLKKFFDSKTEFIEIAEPVSELNCLNAVLAWEGKMSGDIVVISPAAAGSSRQNIASLIKEQRRSGNSCTILTNSGSTSSQNALKVLRNKVNKISGFEPAKEPVESSDEFFNGVYCFRADTLFSELKKLDADHIRNNSVLDLYQSMVNRGVKTNSYCINSLKKGVV
jgi:hypothetical protein